MIPTASNQESLLSRLWPALLIGGAWLWIFWPMMTGQSVVGFRDSAYLYYPLFQWIDAQWAAGEIPLWNPYCNFGMPVVADGTSSVFYPGKLVFFCRFLSYPARYGIYIAIHVPIAAAGAYWFARTLRANRAGATLAAFSFAFGGSVLFQVTNVIYLVSAAWLPFALCCVWKMVKSGEVKWAVAAGVCCALMILGGDPQMVYHVGLIAVATIIGEFLRRKRRRLRTHIKIGLGAYGWLILEASPRLIVMVAVTSLLAAIQLLPTFYWSQLSERTSPTVPSNIYHVLMYPDRMGADAGFSSLIGEPVGTADHSYQFSQPPWSVSELFWPNISGKPFPINQRWTNFLPGADRMWVPSMYASLATVLLAISGIRFWGRSRKRIWLTWLALFFLVASFGWYGLVWLFNEIAPPAIQNFQYGSQVGGLYWLMNMVLPEYFAFRYPAKLVVVAALGISLLAGIGLRKTQLRFVGMLVTLFALFSACGWIAVPSYGDTLFSGLPSDVLFGPFDTTGAIGAMSLCFIQSVVVGTCIAVTTFFILRTRRGKFCQFLLGLVVVISAIELVIANAWLVPQIPSSVLASTSAVQRRLEELKSQIEGREPLRIYRSPNEYFEPLHWKNESCENRLSEIVTWQRESLYPKHHLGEKVVLLGSFASISPSSYERILPKLESQRGWAASQQSQFHPPTGRMYHVTVEPNQLEREVLLNEFKPERYYDLTSPVEWMFEFDPLTERDRSTGYPGCLWNAPTDQFVSNAGDQKACEIIEFGCNRFVAQVSADRPMMLGFLSTPDLGWKAKVTEISPETKRVSKSTYDRLIRSTDWNRASASVRLRWIPLYYDDLLLLPIDKPGKFKIEFVYSPIEFWVGLWVSMFGWISLVAGFALFFLRKRRLETVAKVC